jgi:hypothetical protein
MLDNVLTLTDDSAADHDYDLVSREGMNSVRRDRAVSSDLTNSLVIKNNINLNAMNQENRHLVQLNWKEKDPLTGEYYSASAYMVVARHKKITDASIASKVTMLTSLALQTDFLSNILIGGN